MTFTTNSVPLILVNPQTNINPPMAKPTKPTKASKSAKATKATKSASTPVAKVEAGSPSGVQ